MGYCTVDYFLSEIVLLYSFVKWTYVLLIDVIEFTLPGQCVKPLGLQLTQGKYTRAWVPDSPQPLETWVLVASLVPELRLQAALQQSNRMSGIYELFPTNLDNFQHLGNVPH